MKMTQLYLKYIMGSNYIWVFSKLTSKRLKFGFVGKFQSTKTSSQAREDSRKM